MASHPSLTAESRSMLFHMPVLVETLTVGDKLEHVHRHNYTQIWYVLRGTMLHTIDGTLYEQRPGSCAVVLPYTMHGLHSRDDGDGVYILCVSYADTFLSDRGWSIFSYFKERAFFDGFKIPLYAELSGEDKEHADRTAYAMIDEFGRHRQMSYDRLAELLAELLRIVCTEPAGSTKGLRAITERAVAITDTINFMARNLDKNFTLDELCAYACMSRSAFTKNFKAITGMTSKEYLLAARRSRARLLIMFSDMTLDEIAKETGFYDSAYLTRSFTEAFGMSPKKYREKNIEAAYIGDDIYRERWAWYFDDDKPYTPGLLHMNKKNQPNET